MSMVRSITVTKIEAAQKQLCSAIELWFADADPISIHTLAAASHQIIHDLNRKNKGPELLLDTMFIKDEFRQEYKNFMKDASNFFKHADRGKMGSAKEIKFNMSQMKVLSFLLLLDSDILANSLELKRERLNGGMPFKTTLINRYGALTI